MLFALIVCLAMGANAFLPTKIFPSSRSKLGATTGIGKKSPQGSAGGSTSHPLTPKRLETIGGVQHNSYVEVRPVAALQEGMKMRVLPNSDILVSELCLGTMMFGEQVSKEDAFAQLDAATGVHGINFIDTAESYPAPAAPSTTGRSESIIGEWLRGASSTGGSGKTKASSSRRASTVISTKICGFSDQITWCRKDQSVGTRVNKKQVMEAVDAQLSRLGTDYIDLLQIHWPDRYVQLYGAPEYLYDLERRGGSLSGPAAENPPTAIREQLEIMQELIQKGKIRAFGLSNETPYGIGAFSTAAQLLDLPKPVTVQNCYNLLVRNDFETGMQEACSVANANMGLLAYSPLAGGALTGKYNSISGKTPEEARLRKYTGFMHRYIAPPCTAAIKDYAKMAESFSIPLTQIALAFVYSRPFVTSTVIGATSLQQLEDNVHALNLLPFSSEILTQVNNLGRKHIDPARGAFEIVDPTLNYVDPSKLPWGAKDQDVDPELDALISQRFNKF